MRFEIRWKTGLAPALVAATRARLTLGLARVVDRVSRVVLWRELRTESGSPAWHWVVRVELVAGKHLVVTHPDPGEELQAAEHVGERVSRAVMRNLGLEYTR